ncbi:uncharacterized protein N7473_003525 [Penicillium subrubescens]|nr:uncharacterized protein N7473_003525 [Penicillium subrubescens]KAJ5906609.1 hypothetical protein N7473_003525 [Penicillium subrubescens]
MVPMLLTTADWAQWSASLRVFLDAYDPRIWEIMQGTTVYPQPVPQDTEIIRLLAAQNEKQSQDVTENEISTFKTAARDQDKEWKKLEAHALLLLWSTLGPKPREKIAGITNIKLADEKLLEWRNTPLGQTIASCGLIGPRFGSTRACPLPHLSPPGKMP